MIPTIEEIRLSNLRLCIMSTIVGLTTLDLSASSKEYAQIRIRHTAEKYAPEYLTDEIILEAANRVIECLGWA